MPDSTRPGNAETDTGMQRLQAALTARAAMKSWAEGLELIELVRAAHDAGWLARLRAGTTPSEVAAATGVSVEQVSNVLAVLASAGVVRADGDSFQLAPAFDALVEGASGVDLPTVLAALELARGEVARAVRPIEPGHRLDGGQALALARDWGVRASSGSRTLYGVLYESLPEYRELLEQGGPLLDVGSGVGGALLTTVALFDRVHAVGVEVVEEVAAELRDRARQAGVADRVEIRAIDARELRDEGTFAVSYWAQAFFTTDARADTLAAIHRALRPGGLLVTQELFPPLDAQQEASTRAQLDRLFYRQQNASYGLSAEDLAAEAEQAGFQDARIIVSPLGRLVIVRR